MSNPKCIYCRKPISRDNSYKVLINHKNCYFCNEEEFNLWFAKEEEKRKEKEILQAIFDMIEWSLGSINNRSLWNMITKTLSNLRNHYSLKQIYNYLESDFPKISSIIYNKSFNNEYNKIKYYLAIINNNISDYYDTLKSQTNVEQEKTKKVDFYMAPLNYKNTKKRKTAIEIEQLGDDDDE